METDSIDVMISLHVGSMKSSALALKESLEAKGLAFYSDILKFIYRFTCICFQQVKSMDLCGVIRW